MKFLKTIMVLACAISLNACSEPSAPSADVVQRHQQEQLSAAGNATVGMPAVTNFAEKRMMKNILELRDKMQPTITYVRDMNGKMHKICDSVGYGLPYATQYTNPQKVEWRQSQGYSSAVTAQADPNGLFSPAAAEGTWIMCLNPKNKEVVPVYEENRVTVSPFPLD